MRVGEDATNKFQLIFLTMKFLALLNLTHVDVVSPKSLVLSREIQKIKMPEALI